MRNIWIINESEAIARLLNEELSKLELATPVQTIPSLFCTEGDQWSDSGDDQVCFLAIESIDETHFELLRSLKSATGAKLVVVSPIPQPETVVALIRAGASDVLLCEENLSCDLSAVLGRLRSESNSTKSNGRVVTILPTGDVCDANILATNLAAVIAAKERSCALVDLHLGGGDLATMLKLQPKHTLFDLLTQQEVVDDAMIEQAIVRHASGIDLLASPPLFNDMNRVNLQPCGNIFRFTNRTRPFTILNAERTSFSEQIYLDSSSESIVLTTRLDVISISRTQETLRFLSRIGVDSSNIWVVAMRTGCDGELPYVAVKKVLKVDRLFCIPDDPIGFTVSLNLGNPLVLESPRSAASQQIQSFVESLIGYPESLPQRPSRASHLATRFVNRLSQAFSVPNARL